MGRVAKRPQQRAFNQRQNCFGRFQSHDLSVAAWRDRRRPLMLEIGAGTAAIALGFSLKHPDWQVIALDRKSERLDKAAKEKTEENLVFLHSEIDSIGDHADLSGQVNLIWLAFPDPFPKKRQAKHRLTHPDRLAFYKYLLTSGGRIRFKTDNAGLFAYSLEVLEGDADFKVLRVISDLARVGYGREDPDVGTLTSYERRFLDAGLPIRYLEVELMQHAAAQG